MIDIEAVGAIANDARYSADRRQYLRLALPVQAVRSFGADIVVHSATKFIGGHGTSMGGVMIESGKFDWGNGNFPGMTEPSAGVSRHRFYETFGDFGFTMKARCETLRTLGQAMSPFNAFMLLQGIETLPVRMDRHCANAMGVAEFLREHPAVTWVNYAGLEDNPYRDLVKKYLPKGAGSIMTFGVEGGAAAGGKIHQQRAVHESPGQRRRRAHADHPSGVDHPPPAVRGAADRRRRHPRHGAHLGRPGNPRRYPLGPRPGLEKSQK